MDAFFKMDKVNKLDLGNLEPEKPSCLKSILLKEKIFWYIYEGQV